MTTNTIVQLARFNSTDKPSNAEWTTKIREPIILNEGDTLSVRQAFVDSRLNSSTNIVIDVDTELSLTYYFYMMFPCDVNSWQDVDILQASSYIAGGDNYPYFSNTERYAATDYVAFAAPNGYTEAGTGHPANPGDPGATAPVFERLQLPLNTFETARGQPQPPYGYENGSITDFPPTVNQCQAVEIPMLLITNDIGDGNTPYENIPITKTWTYTLKAGSYSPGDLADLLTKNMAEIQTKKIKPSISPNQLFGGSVATNLNNFLIKGTAISQSLNVPVDDNYPDAFVNGNRYDDNLVTGGNVLFSSNSPLFANQPQHSGVFSNFLTDTPFNTDYFDSKFSNYYGNYILSQPNGAPDVVNPANLALQATNPIMFMPSHYAGGYGLQVSETVTPPYGVNEANWYREYSSAVVGATQISLEYDPNTSVFQFTYLHTPLLEQPLTAGTSSTSASEPVEVVKIIKTVNINMNRNQELPATSVSKSFGEIKICEQTRHSGVFFQSMQPASFWQNIMGFDVPNITFSADKVWGPNKTLNFEQFNKITTSGYVGIENNFNTTMTSAANSTSIPVVKNENAPSYLAPFPADLNLKNFVYTYTQLLNSDEWILENYILQNDQAPADPGGGTIFYNYGAIAGAQSGFYQEYSSALNATNPLMAIQIPLSQTNGTGHYFVEIVGYNNNTNDFVNDNSIYAVKSIVAAYYVSPNSFITQPFADTAVYQHIGNSQHINKFRVRLLDPLTMQPAAPLGPNSSVYLQLGRNISKLAITQPV